MILFILVSRIYVSRSRNKENTQSSSIVILDHSKSSGPTRRHPHINLNSRRVTRSIPRSIHVSSRPPSQMIQSYSPNENLYIQTPYSQMTRMSMRLKRSWITRMYVGNDGIWYIGWDIPHLTINGSILTTSTHLRSSNHILIEST